MSKPITPKKVASDLWGLVQVSIDAEVLAEREACAKVCEGRIGGAVLDDQWMLGFKAAMRQCAEAIRARGQA